MKKKVLALLLASSMVFSMAACSKTSEEGQGSTPAPSGSGSQPSGGSATPAPSGSGSQTPDVTPAPEATKTPLGPVTYRDYTVTMPSNWNELTYLDNNDTQIMNYLVSSFFEYDFKYEGGKKFKDDGTINAEAILPGEFEVLYSAATKLEDVTSKVDAKWGYTDEQKAAGSYAWKITLRQDLKWDDGTPINANDFIYTMQQQLDPLFQNSRASSYYNNIMVKGARAYVYQGQTVWVDNGNTGEPAFAVDDLVKGDDGVYTQKDGGGIKFVLTEALKWCGGHTVTEYSGYLDADAFKALQALADEKGRVPVTDDTIALVTKLIDTDDWGHEPPENVPLYMYYEVVYGEKSFEDVGYYASGDYELVVCLDAPIKCLKDDGSLSYEAAYSFSGMPLVKKDLYEKCKQAPQEGSTLWTTNYNTSLETSASWGPYKVSAFQAGKSYEMTKNENWFGYGMEQYKDQYLIDKIFYEQVTEDATRWIKFLGGEIDGIGLDVDHKADFRDSKYTKFAPGTGTYGTMIYSNLDVLRTNGRNNGILAIDDFRKAISLYLDRDDFNTTLFTSHRPCYGLLGPAYYHDIENGGVYRSTQQAKEGLLRVYGFTQNADGTWTDGTNKYATYEDAYDVMNGMNRPLAKELVEKAYKELTDNADKYGYDPNKQITLLQGASSDTEGGRRANDYMSKLFSELTAGTPLEGKIEVKFDASFGSGWVSDFKAGAYDLAVTVGFSGGAFDPCGFLQCYMDPTANLMYSVWWDVDAEMLTFAMPAGDYDGAGKEYTMSVYNWYCCLNGLAESRGCVNTFNWGDSFAPADVRLLVLSKLEEVCLNKYYAIMTTSTYSASVYSAKFDTVTDEYNTFMTFGGIQYMRPMYDDAAWAEYVKANNNDLTAEYKKVE